MRLVMEHLSKQFKNRIAVESIDTELREGVYGFLGANGAGKTTLMQMICGIIEPTAGEVKINGENSQRRLWSSAGQPGLWASIHHEASDFTSNPRLGKFLVFRV